MATKYIAISTTSLYMHPTTASLKVGVISKDTSVSVYSTAQNGKWLALNEEKTVWAPMYDASTKPIFKVEKIDNSSKVDETKASDLNKNNSSTTKVDLYRVGTNWVEGKCVNQVGAYEKKQNAINECDRRLKTNKNYKVYDANGKKIYPVEAPTSSNSSTNNTTSNSTNMTKTVKVKEEEDNYVDLMELYTKGTDVGNDYVKSIDSLTVRHIKGVMGLPYQWLPTQDPRLEYKKNNTKGDQVDIGRTYGDKILSRVPLLLITPGTADFMANYTKNEAESIISKLISSADKITSDLEEGLEQTITRDGKYYSFKFDYNSYYNCVNPMCRAAAYFLGIEDTVVYGIKLKNYEHGRHGRNQLDKFLGTYRGCIPFYVDSETSIQDSFGNDTTQSALADKINGYSSMANELNYILGSSKAGALYDTVSGELAGSVENLGQFVDDIMGGSNLITSISQNLSAVLAGGKLIFPEIWSDSSFTRSYDVTIKLSTPDNDKLSWYLNVWVPLAYLMGLVLPRQVDANGYISPFLVRAFYKGLFNVDMGIITNMSVQKGGDGRWTKDGLPTSIEVNFTIKDLYNYMALSDAPKMGKNLMNNITLLDYIGNTCGININEIDIIRKAEMYLMVGGVGTVQDKIVNNMFGSLDQWLTNKVSKIFGFFD